MKELLENAYKNNPHFKDYREYVEDNNYVRFHEIEYIAEYSLNHYKTKQEQETVKENLIMGSLIHMFILENKPIYDLVITYPNNIDKRKKEDKILFEKLYEQALTEHKILIKEEDYENILNMYNSYYDILNETPEYEKIKEVLFSGEKEKIIKFDYKGLNIKSMLDCVKDNVIIDLKTTINASPKHFINDIRRYKYDLQLGFYAIGLYKLYDYPIDYIQDDYPINEIECYIVALEKQKPYDMSIYKIDLSSKLIERINDMIDQYKYKIRFCPTYERNIILYEQNE